jgi:hypothetical protein
MYTANNDDNDKNPPNEAQCEKSICGLPHRQSLASTNCTNFTNCANFNTPLAQTAELQVPLHKLHKNMDAFSPAPHRSDILAALSAEQRAILDQWILDRRYYKQICEDLAKPPPEGFSIQVSPSTICRYRDRHLRNRQIAEATAPLAELPNPRASLGELLKNSALTMAVDMASPTQPSPDCETSLSPDTFQTLARYYRILSNEEYKQKLAEQRDLQLQLARERLNHHRRVFEFNAARAALSAVCELQKIADDPQMDDEQKIWAARQHLFGALPDTEPQPKPLDQFIQ